MTTDRIKITSYTRRKPFYMRLPGTRRRITKWRDRVRLFFRRLTIASLLLTIVATSYFSTFTLGQLSVREDSPASESFLSLAHAEIPRAIPPVLVRVRHAESLDSHYCTEKLIAAAMCSKSELGQVLVRANKNGTIDVGKYQVNVYYWGAEATALGYDLFDEDENEKMALWIYENHGTDPWTASAKKWR